MTRDKTRSAAGRSGGAPPGGAPLAQPIRGATGVASASERRRIRRGSHIRCLAPWRTTAPTGSSWSDHGWPTLKARRSARQRDHGRFVLEQRSARRHGTVYRARDIRQGGGQDRNPYVAIKISMKILTPSGVAPRPAARVAQGPETRAIQHRHRVRLHRAAPNVYMVRSCSKASARPAHQAYEGLGLE